jgi:hypothetical protein
MDLEPLGVTHRDLRAALAIRRHRLEHARHGAAFGQRRVAKAIDRFDVGVERLARCATP